MFQHNFRVTQTEFALIEKIVNRYAAKVHLGSERAGLVMDLMSCHNGACPLGLTALLAGPDLDFFHDVAGIYRHFNRETGELDNCFTPRFAQANGHV